MAGRQAWQSTLGFGLVQPAVREFNERLGVLAVVGKSCHAKTECQGSLIQGDLQPIHQMLNGFPIQLRAEDCKFVSAVAGHGIYQTNVRLEQIGGDRW